MIRVRRIGWRLSLLALLWAPTAYGATMEVCTVDSPCTLGGLISSGGSFQSADMSITFSNFEAIATGALASIPLTDIAIVQTASGLGLDLIGGLSAQDGEIGDLLIRYDVSAMAPLTQATLTFNGEAFGVGAGASVIETFGSLPDQGFVFVTGGGGQVRNHTVQLDGLQSFRVTSDIIVDSSLLAGGLGGTADISLITENFIPEPGTAFLLLLGLGGLAVARRAR